MAPETSLLFVHFSVYEHITRPVGNHGVGNTNVSKVYHCLLVLSHCTICFPSKELSCPQTV